MIQQNLFSQPERHSVERMYLQQNPKIGPVWRPVALQPYVIQKGRPTQETPWPLDYNVE